MHRCTSATSALLLTILVMQASGQYAMPWCFAEDARQPKSVRVSTRDELLEAVAQAKPGTTILIAPGNYRGDLHFAGLQGTEAQPFILRALDAKRPPVIEAGGSCLHLSDPAYVELHDLVFVGARGNGLNIDDGGTPGSPAHHLVLRGLTIRDIGPKGNCDGLKLSGVDDFRIEACTFESWGDSGSAIDMVGCHEGVIDTCSFRHREENEANGVQTKGGSERIIIRSSRFVNAGNRAVNIGGSTGAAFFRPPMAQYEARDITVEDCTFIGSMSPIAFVGVDGATVRYNTIYRPSRWIIRILQESRGEHFVPCRKGSFTNNVIAYRSDEVRAAANIGQGVQAETFAFAKNYWYCIDAPGRSRPTLPGLEAEGQYGSDPKFMDVSTEDLRFGDSSPVRDAGARSKAQ